MIISLKYLKQLPKAILIYLKDKYFLGKSVSILMYHSISDNNEFFTVSSSQFEWQMNYLYKNNYNVISLERLLNLLNSRQKIPKKTVAITFDDGYEDNYSNALPVLRNYNFPAVIFLTTGKIGDKDYINKRGIKMPMLDWSQIEDMHNTDLINFGSHTVSHPRLSKIQIEKAMIEMKNSKYEIETRLNKKCRFFCLPYGDYNVEVINMAREIFELCLTVERGFVSYIDDKFLLKRNSVDSLTTPFIFKLKI